MTGSSWSICTRRGWRNSAILDLALRIEGEPVAVSKSSCSAARRASMSGHYRRTRSSPSDRLALRPMEAADAEQIAAWLRNEPAYDFGLGRFPLSAVEIDDWIKKIGEKEPPSEIEFAVVLRESGELIGENGLYSIDWLARTAESGTWIYRPEYRGSGYGTEAKHLLLEYAFDRLGLNMIWSWVKMSNTRSQAALRKQGYRDAGRRPLGQSRASRIRRCRHVRHPRQRVAGGAGQRGSEMTR